MIEQLWYTWSSFGLAGNSGFQVRAASDGLSDLQGQRFKEMDPQLRYYLPTGTDLYEATTTTSPTTLSFIRTGAGNILVHKVYLGNSDGGRPGNYFCHALASLPDTFTACDAIELWESPFWQNSASTMPEDVTSLATINEGELRRTKGLLDYNAILEVKEFLPFVIRAFLLLKFDQKLYIYAPDKIVAALIWGLAHSIPRSMHRRLTFSTYEQNVDKENVDKADIRVVGSCRAPISSADQQEYAYPSRQEDLPADCYSGGRGFAINCYTRKLSPLPEKTLDEAPRDAIFAQFATQCLVDKDKRNDLISMLQQAENINFVDADSFLFFYKYYTADERELNLSEQEITSLVRDYDLATILLKRKGIQDAIIKLVSGNPQWWTDHGAAAFEILENPNNAGFGKSAAEALLSLAMNSITGICNSTFHRDWAMFKRLKLFLLKITPIERNPAVWVHLQLKLTEPYFSDTSYHPGNYFDWNAQLGLLLTWREIADQIADKDIQPWLEVSWEGLGVLFERTLPSKWYTMAIEMLLNSSLPVPNEVSTFAQKYYEPFQTALERVMQTPSKQLAGIRFFQQMAKYGCRKRLEMLFAMLNYDIEVRENFEVLLRSANLTPPEIIMVFENRTWQVLRYVAVSPAVQNMVELYIDNFTLGKLDTSGREVLKILQEFQQYFPAQLVGAKSRINAWNLASSGYPPKGNYPPLNVEAAHLKAMRDALVLLRLGDQPQYRDRLFRVIINTPLEHDELDLVIKCFAPVLTRSQSRRELLAEIGTFIGSRYKSNENFPDLWKTLLPYIMLALVYAHELPDSAKDKFINYILPRAILQHVDKETFNKIDRDSRTWPPEISEKWNLYVGSLRPSGRLEKIIGVTEKFLRRIPQPPLMQNAEAQFGVYPSANQGKPSGVTAGEPRLPTSGTPPVDPTQRSYTQPAPPQKDATQQGQVNFPKQNQPTNPTKIEIGKIRKIKNVYYSIKITQFRKQISTSKSQVNNEQLLSVIDSLESYLHLEQKKQNEVIQRELEEIKSIPDNRKKELSRKFEDILGEIKDILGEINRSDGYRSQLSEITNVEIRDVLFTYIYLDSIEDNIK